MNLTELANALKEQNEKKGGYQIHLNCDSLEDKRRYTGIEFGNLYFTECSAINNGTLLCFGNMNRNPVSQKEDGTDVYPMEINNNLFIDVRKIGAIEEVKDFEDWFGYPSARVINLYMYPENNPDGVRNIITVGFME